MLIVYADSAFLINPVEIEVARPESALVLYAYMLFDLCSQTNVHTCYVPWVIIFAFFCVSDKLHRKWESIALVLVLSSNLCLFHHF